MKPVWKNEHISLALKVRLYKLLVLSTMLYSAELWPLSLMRKKSWKRHITNFIDGTRKSRKRQLCRKWNLLSRKQH